MIARKPCLVALAVVAGGLALAPQPLAAKEGEPRITAAIETKPNSRLTAQERRAVSIAAGRLVKHAFDARAALALKAKARALANVEKALKLAAIIELAMPTYHVTARIAAGDLVYEDEEEVQPIVVPVLEAYDRAALVAPLAHARSEAEKKNKIVDRPALSSVGVETVRVTLDLATAKAALLAAKADLEADRLDAADADLALVESALVFTRVVIPMPLDTARADLVAALDAVEGDDLKEAAALLEAAADAMGTYARSVSGKAAEKAEALRDEIADLAVVVATDSEGATDKILGWLQKLEAMPGR